MFMSGAFVGNSLYDDKLGVPSKEEQAKKDEEDAK